MTNRNLFLTIAVATVIGLVGLCILTPEGEDFIYFLGLAVKTAVVRLLPFI